MDETVEMTGGWGGGSFAEVLAGKVQLLSTHVGAGYGNFHL